MSDALDELLGVSPVMAIFRDLPLDTSVQLAHRAWDAGIALVEVPIRTTAAVEVLAAVAAAGRERDRPVAAGTVLTAEQVPAAAAAGAAFTVAPGLDEQVLAAAGRAGLPHLPGVATATEVQRATALGCRWLKAFPAASLGTAWFTAVRGPFPGVSFVATGGIDASNAAAFLAAGARTVAVGSALADPAQLERLAALVRAAA